MTHLPIPSHTGDVLQWVDLVARAHGTAGVVEVPNIYLRLTGSRGQQIGLERVNIKGSHGTDVLLRLTNDCIFRLRAKIMKNKRATVITREKEKDRERERKRNRE